MYFKLPTYAADLLVHFSVFYLSLYFSGLLSGLQAAVMRGNGTSIILFLSYVCAITIVPIRLNERRIANYMVLLRALAQTVLTVSIFIFVTSAVYKITPVKFYLLYGVTAGILIIVLHLLIRYIILCIRRSGKNRLNVIMVGADERLVAISREMKAGYGVNG